MACSVTTRAKRAPQPHMQAPAVHTCGLTHAEPDPHWHWPEAEQLSVVPGSHVVHSAPSIPHVENDEVSQVTPEQQPAGQDVASQTHAPRLQRWPGSHAGPPPHVHAPLRSEHPSPYVPQLEHDPPSLPHWTELGVSHVLPEQQPLGQELASQTQLPASHSCPDPHAAPLPHVQAPAGEQPSAFAPHALHAPPFAPHAIAEGLTHIEPEQQPLGQVVELHPAQLPALQTCGEGHDWHAAPPAPQTPATLPGSHVVPEQHPLHELPSHTQAPPWQCCPVEHAGPAPQVHVPEPEQPSPVVPQSLQVDPFVPHAAPVGGSAQTLPVQQLIGHDAALQRQAPPLQICPGPHAAPEPQWQTPEPEQLSLVDGSQVVQALPLVPHVDSDAVVHVVPEQQPAGQDVELHTHAPLEQTCPLPHMGDDPQLHAPDDEQLSAFVVSHAEQAAPLTPHVVTDGASQVAPAQHPLGQLEEVHPVQVPDVHVCGLGHV